MSRILKEAWLKISRNIEEDLFKGMKREKEEEGEEITGNLRFSEEIGLKVIHVLIESVRESINLQLR